MTKPARDRRRFLTMKEAAAHLQIGYGTMREYLKRDDGPPFYRFTARCIRFPHDDFMAWVESKSRGGNLV